MNFTGRELHNVDDKGRASMPARFREVIAHTSLGAQAFSLMVVPWFGECVRIYPLSRWEKLVGKLEEQLGATDAFGYGEDESDIRRLLFGMAQEIKMDGHGRFSLPQYIRDEAGISRDISWVGLGEYLEIWDSERLQARLSGENARRLRARMAELFSAKRRDEPKGDDEERAPENTP